MQEIADEALMQAYADGDSAAFERLYARHRGPLYRFILRRVGDPAAANDLYQGCWEKVIRARASYTARAPFRAWLYRIARNHVVDHFRRSRPTGELVEETIETGNPGPEQLLIGEQAAGRLLSAVSALPAEQREVLLLRLEAGLDVATIAEITATAPETAKSRLRYAIAKLKRSLGPEQDGADP